MDPSSIFLLVMASIFVLSLIGTNIMKMQIDYKYVREKYSSARKFYIYSLPVFLVQMLMACFFVYYALTAYRGFHFMVNLLLILSILSSVAFMLATNDVMTQREGKLDRIIEEKRKSEEEKE